MSDQQLDEEPIATEQPLPPTDSSWGTECHPVTISQVLQSGDSLIVEGRDFTVVKLVAHVTRVGLYPGGASFTLEDGTGSICAVKDLLTVQFELQEAEEDEIAQCEAFEHTYVEVMAKLHKSNSAWKPRIWIRSICLANSYHQVMYHILHVMHNSILAQNLSQPHDPYQDSRSNGEDAEYMLVDDVQADQDDISIQHHITCAFLASPPVLPSTFSPQKHQPYATLEPLEKAIIKHMHHQRNTPLLIAELAQAIQELCGCTESQFNLALQVLLSEAYITSPLDDGYVVITPRH